MTITSKLATVENIKSAIKQAIINKGGSVGSSDAFNTYSAKIEALPSGVIGETRTEALTSTSGDTFTPSTGKNAITSITVTPTNQAKTITPTTSSQTISVPSGYSGFGTLTVNAVTSSIDSDIVAGNIKSGVNILGVAGNVTQLVGETRSVSITSTSGNTFTPTSGKNGITSITVSPTNQAKTITPTTSQQTISVPSGYSGFGALTVNAVTASIDSNITAGNIKDGVTILGVTGTMKSGYTEIPSYQVSNGVATRRSGALTGNEFSNITSVGNYGFQYAFYGCFGLTGNLNLSSLTSVGIYGLYNAFYNCYGLTSIDLSSLTSVRMNGLYYAFYNCSGLTSIDLSSLTSIGDFGLSYTFYNCSGLTRVDLPSVTSISVYGLSYAFRDCKGLTDVYFNSLITTSFGSYTSQFTNMLSGTGSTTTHTLHFPSNLESTIQGLTGYPTFGGTSGYVVLSFDLPATS